MRAVFTAIALLFAVGVAQADDHHKKPVLKPIKQGDNVIGFRVTAQLHKQHRGVWAKLHVGSMKVPEALKTVDRRALANGDIPGYARWSSPNVEIKQGEVKEIQYDILYGQGNDLKPGDKVDIYTTFDQGHKHVWGMHEGPVHSGDMDYVFELPK